MKISISILFFMIVSLLIIQIASAEENEYGIVRAWFNDENATVKTIEGVQLKIGEPVEIKVEVTSKINGNVYVELDEPGITKSYDMIAGSSKMDESIDNHNIIVGWSKTYSWTLKPNGAWKNGNAPINIRVSFSKKGDQKPIQFTIANPYILDKQYTGAATTPAPEITGTGAPTKEMPFLPVLFMVSALLLAWRLKKS
ncbi:MAG: sarcinarray family MAST domain-containing protein [Candidatus Methanoperedens sp.]|nr:sarcinarray family MAST domain-containing protein [Candidatus Methanoperedens sp.]